MFVTVFLFIDRYYIKGIDTLAPSPSTITTTHTPAQTTTFTTTIDELHKQITAQQQQIFALAAEVLAYNNAKAAQEAASSTSHSITTRTQESQTELNTSATIINYITNNNPTYNKHKHINNTTNYNTVNFDSILKPVPTLCFFYFFYFELYKLNQPKRLRLQQSPSTGIPNQWDPRGMPT